MADEVQKSFDVVAIGDAIVDVLVKADDSFLSSLGLQKKSVTKMDQEKANSLFSYLSNMKIEEMEELTSIIEMSGGSAANTAAGLASFGAKVGYIGRVHGDLAGKRFSDKLEARGIEYRTPPAVNSGGTGRSLVIVTPDGTRTMCTYIGTSVQEEDVDEAMIQDAKVIFLPVFLWESESGKKAANKAIELAKKHHTQVAISLSDPDCVKRHRTEILTLVGGSIDFVFANSLEAASLLETPDHETSVKAFKALCDQRPFVAVITNAEKGADIATKDGIINAAGVKVDAIVDKTGIGALFVSGFLYGYTHGYALEQCGTLGNMAAAEGLKTLGARPKSDLSQLLKNVQKPNAA